MRSIHTIRALLTAEDIANRYYYAEVVSKSIPPDLKDILRSHFSDEKNHLEYIRNNLQVL